MRVDKPRKTYEAPIDEVVDRCRRIETRLTQYLETIGFDTQALRPVYEPSRDGRAALLLPNINVSVKDVLAALPDGVADEVLLVLNGKPLGLLKPRQWF